MKQAISNIVKLALIGGLIYVAINWQSMSSSGGSDVERFAESACVDAVKSRYDVTGVRAYKTSENANGFTVRLSATTRNREPAKLVCLTTPQGGVRDVSVDVR